MIIQVTEQQQDAPATTEACSPIGLQCRPYAMPVYSELLENVMDAAEPLKNCDVPSVVFLCSISQDLAARLLRQHSPVGCPCSTSQDSGHP